MSIIDNLTISLNTRYKCVLKRLCDYNINREEESNELFDKLIIKLYKKERTLSKYSKNPRINRCETRVTSENFCFKYIIYPDLKSEIILEKKIRIREVFNREFVLTKIKGTIGYVYFIKSEFGYKIGKTKDLKYRLSTFEVKLPFETSLFAYFECVDYDTWESLLHKSYKDKHINGEWFDLSDEDFKDIDKEIRSKGFALIYD